MAAKSAIEWTDASWNFLKGCTPVSAGCLNCYAAGVAHQKQNHPNPKVSAQFAGLTTIKRAGEGQRAVFNGRINVVEHLIEVPLRWREPKRIFVNSLSDLFHPDVPVEVIDRAFGVMALCPQHTFQILTKRPERMAAYLADDARGAVDGLLALHHATGRVDQWPLPNVWVGTSVEDQAAADERIPHLLSAPAAVRFLSCEPLLAPLDLSRWMPPGRVRACCSGCGTYTSDPRSITNCKGYCFDETGKSCDAMPCPHCGRFHYWCGSHVGNGRPNEQPIGWVIVGGESGSRARPMHPDWARSLRDQCQAAGVPFLFKQWGEHLPLTQSPEWAEKFRAGKLPRAQHGMVWERPATATHGPAGSSHGTARVGKHAAGRELDGRTWDEFPGEVTHG